MPMSWWFCSERLPFYWCKRLPRQREELDFQWFHPWPKQLTASAHVCRLQNSPYFCVFKYARAVKQKVWNEAENRERDWGEKRVIRTNITYAKRTVRIFSVSPHCFFFSPCSKIFLGKKSYMVLGLVFHLETDPSVGKVVLSTQNRMPLGSPAL